MLPRLTFFVGGLVGVAVLVAGAQASSSLGVTTVSCGETLTTSTTLANDLIDCPGTGLVIGDDNVTINLDGHTIDGVNAAKIVLA